jgi:hypothetical protein
MARGIELGMRDHHHLPGMPRIAGTNTALSCMHCGLSRAVVPELSARRAVIING